MKEITVSEFSAALGLGSWYRKDTSLLSSPRFWDYVAIYIRERCISPEDEKFAVDLLVKPISVVMDDPLFILISGEDNPMERKIFSVTTEHSWGWMELAELEIYSLLKRAGKLELLFSTAAIEMIQCLDKDWESERKKASEMKQLERLAKEHGYELRPINQQTV